jgi:hypothetical protein
LPSGVIAIVYGRRPTLIVSTTVSVATSIAEIEPLSKLAT